MRLVARLLLPPLLLAAVLGYEQEVEWPGAKSIYDFEARDLEGAPVELSKYRGHVLVLFNGATRSCPVSSKAFKQLQELQDRYGDTHGLKVAVFVVDGAVKASGSADDIREFVASNKFTLDFYDKVAYNGEDAHPVYKWIKALLPEDDQKIAIATKFVFDRSGWPMAMLGSKSSPVELEEAVKHYF